MPEVFPILLGDNINADIAAVRAAYGCSIVVGIPWFMMAPHEPQAVINHSQTLERLAERGGLSASEACAVLDDRPYRTMTPPEAHSHLKDLFQAWVSAGMR